MNWMDTTSSIAAFNSEASGYDTGAKSDNDAASIKPCQFEPSTELSIVLVKNQAKKIEQHRLVMTANCVAIISQNITIPFVYVLLW